MKYPNLKTPLAKAKTDKSTYTRLWDLALMYLQGKQHIVYDKNLKSYVTARMDQHKAQYTVNLLVNIYRHIVSRLAVEYPSISVLPASPSTEDILKARSSEEALKYYWHNNNMKEVINEAVKWLVSTGNVGLQTFYDPDLESVGTKVVSPYDLFYEYGVKGPEESQWVAVRQVVVKEELEKRFPRFKDKISALPDAVVSYGGGSWEDAPEGRAEIYEVYWKDGRYALINGDLHLFEGEYPVGATPVQLIRYTDIPYSLWGVGLVSNLLDLQSLYNRVRNQVVDNVDLMSHPKWLIPKTAGVPANSIKGKPGEKIYYNAAGGAPQQIAGAGLPQYVMNHIQQLQNEMLDVAGLHSTSVGKRAVGINSAASINALSENDTSQLQVTQQNIEYAVQNIAKTILIFMKEYYDKPKMMRMLDGQGSVVFKSISSTEVVDTPEIFIEAGSLFRDETMDRKQRILDMVEMGIIDKDEAAAELHFKTDNKSILDKLATMSHAQDMLKAAVAGRGIEFFPTDDLDLIERVFAEYIRSPDFYELSPHLQQHVSKIYGQIFPAKGQKAQLQQLKSGGAKAAKQQDAEADAKKAKAKAELNKELSFFNRPAQTQGRGPGQPATSEEAAARGAEAAMGGGVGGGG